MKCAHIALARASSLSTSPTFAYITFPAFGTEKSVHNRMRTHCVGRAHHSRSSSALCCSQARGGEVAAVSKSPPPFIKLNSGRARLRVPRRPDPPELPEFGPEFKKLWDAYFANAPDKPVLSVGILTGGFLMLVLPANL